MARRNVYTLTPSEWDRVAAAFNAIKASGVYDDFTRRHVSAMMELTLLPGETGTLRNVAHRGPSFGPWHRQALREFELQLRNVDPAPPPLELPYWNWSGEGAGWRVAPIWGLVGGNGDPANGNRVATGPFSHWDSLIWSNGNLVPREGIVRQFAATGSMPAFAGMGIPSYDVAPWSETSDPNLSLRRRLEGNHNSVHVLIGGDMGTGASPNDPVFWLHHANCDRIWAEWQLQHGIDNYQPQGGGPVGHNAGDVMRWHLSQSTTCASVLDWESLGTTYDTIDPGGGDPGDPDGGPIAASNLTSGSTTAGDVTYTTAPVAPGPNRLVLVSVVGMRNGGHASISVSGGGMDAWEPVASTTFDAGGARVSVFRALTPTPGAGPITIRFPTQSLACYWSVEEFAGVDTSGANGAGAIVQTEVLDSGTATTASLGLALAPFERPGNVAFGAVSHRASEATAAGAGFSELSDNQNTAPSFSMQTEWAIDDPTVDASWATPSRYGAIAAEIRAQAG